MRKLLITAALLTMSFASFAQERKPWFDAWDLYIVPKAGITYSNLTSMGGDAKIGINAGIIIESHVTERFSVNFDLAYAQVGSNNVYHPNAVDMATGPYEYQLSYLNTQYKFRYYITKNLNVFAGLHFARLFKAKTVFEGNKTNVKKDLHSGDFLFPVGAEFSFKNLAIEATYHVPFRKIARTEKAEQIMGAAKQNLITVTLGYKIQMF